MQLKSWAICRDLMTEVVLIDSSKWPLIFQGPSYWKTGRIPQMEHSTDQFQRGHAPL